MTDFPRIKYNKYVKKLFFSSSPMGIEEISSNGNKKKKKTELLKCLVDEKYMKILCAHHSS